jgi:hypothetical protein
LVSYCNTTWHHNPEDLILRSPLLLLKLSVTYSDGQIKYVDSIPCLV